MHYLTITDNVCARANAHFQHRQMHFQSRFFLNLRGFAVRVFSELLTRLEMMSPSGRNGYMHHGNNNYDEWMMDHYGSALLQCSQAFFILAKRQV